MYTSHKMDHLGLPNALGRFFSFCLFCLQYLSQTQITQTQTLCKDQCTFVSECLEANLGLYHYHYCSACASCLRFLKEHTTQISHNSSPSAAPCFECCHNVCLFWTRTLSTSQQFIILCHHLLWNAVSTQMILTPSCRSHKTQRRSMT